MKNWRGYKCYHIPPQKINFSSSRYVKYRRIILILLRDGFSYYQDFYILGLSLLTGYSTSMF